MTATAIKSVVPDSVKSWLKPEPRGEHVRDLTYLPWAERRIVNEYRATRGKVDGGVPVEVHPKPLNGLPVPIRRGASDAQVVWDTFVGEYHLPPEEIRAPQYIFDLGANIGTTVAHFAVRYPSAKVIGYELDPTLASIATRVVEPLGRRAIVLNNAIWTENGTVPYEIEHGEEFGARIADGGQREVEAVSMNHALRRIPHVDYVKIDIEGAERELLTVNTEWASKVSTMKVELHEPYSFAEAKADLERLGFNVRSDTRHWACAVAWR